ncbi:MAG: ABC transporter permease [Verrucomicrobiota bacterium]
MPWYLYLAIKQLFPTGRRFPFFTAISVLGVTLGVALLVVVMSVMGGFGYEIRRMITDTQGEVQVRGDGQVLVEQPEELRAAIAAVPGVAGVTPNAAGVGLLKFEKKSAFPQIQGIDVRHIESVANLNRFILQPGSLDDLDDDSVILSGQLAETLGAHRGDKIEFYSLLMIEKLQERETMLPRELRVAGFFEVGHQQLDGNTALVTLRRMQDLYGLGHAVHGFNVRLAPGEDAAAAAARITAALPPAAGVRAYPWTDSFSDFLWVLQLEKNMIFFLLLFIVIVAAFSVTSSLLISVVRKTREIGLLGALGGRPGQVAACFCTQGLLIGGGGTVCGLGLGFVLLWLRNDIVLGLAHLFGRDDVMRQFYQVTRLPSHTSGTDVAEIVVFTLVISTLAGLLPAWRAARLKPVEALRHE